MTSVSEHLHPEGLATLSPRQTQSISGPEATESQTLAATEEPNAESEGLALTIPRAAPAFAGTTSKRQTLGLGRTSPFRTTPFKLQRSGRPKYQDSRSNNSLLQRYQEWDERHHLKCDDNDLKPQLIREYFSKPEPLSEVMKTLRLNASLSSPSLSDAGLRSGPEGMLRKLAAPEARAYRSFVTADSGPSLLPARHSAGGEMRDRDGRPRTWNNRWHRSVAMLNDQCHPDHREYFTQTSLFAASPSQRYRRFLDQEDAPGLWTSIATKKPSRFPPMGGRLRGRSGTPVPEP
mmetsp:Transcript_36836/g.102225  ORF Transcript_36836/g.102225 Transcript_36836/m.102225 type:complete len:291 (+) Transcript_36836:135-1007(+)|eukprot:CAMPEP_0179122742 /NCGR_PEP_ID=MMETSP0796-20121207/57939_1 /TAXON_ID=73915 /ORGANISM="Pyrodinium bahamense, Strain pbaha01" /LENGTH=290 /DNA_ID=CAMNT_0020821367 /DNA_START=119 /DNA_END=991 /DNA_ORIENTATION=+